MLDQVRSGAPRLRLGALIAVGVIVVGLVAYAMARPDAVARGWTSPSGRVCVSDGDRVWRGWDPVIPVGETSIAIEGTLVANGAQTAELTTPAGRTISLQTDQHEGDWRNGMVACAITAA